MEEKEFEPTPEQRVRPVHIVFRTMAQISYIGFRIATCVFIGVFSGKYLDGVLGTSPNFLLLFSLLGAGAAFKIIYDQAKR